MDALIAEHTPAILQPTLRTASRGSGGYARGSLTARWDSEEADGGGEGECNEEDAAYDADDSLREILGDEGATEDGHAGSEAVAGRAAEERDRDHFSRRSALLIESLNSTAIDVAKILSNDVTDFTSQSRCWLKASAL